MVIALEHVSVKQRYTTSGALHRPCGAGSMIWPPCLSWRVGLSGTWCTQLAPSLLPHSWQLCSMQQTQHGPGLRSKKEGEQGQKTADKRHWRGHLDVPVRVRVCFLTCQGHPCRLLSSESLVGVRRVLKRATCSFCVILNLILMIFAPASKTLWNRRHIGPRAMSLLHLRKQMPVGIWRVTGSPLLQTNQWPCKALGTIWFFKCVSL